MQSSAQVLPAEILPGHLHLLTGLGPSAPLLEFLSERGIDASSGSACTTEIDKPSHVLTAMGIDAEAALSALRLTAGRAVEMEDVETVASAIADYARRVCPSRMSPGVLPGPARGITASS